MAHITSRAYIKDKNIYGDKKRSLLGLKDSAVLITDDNRVIAYCGRKADINLIDPSTNSDGIGEVVQIPTDFRMVGIGVLDKFGISKSVQAQMFNNFMKNYSPEQRKIYVDTFDALDKTDNQAIIEFVNNMVDLLM